MNKMGFVWVLLYAGVVASCCAERLANELLEYSFELPVNYVEQVDADDGVVELRNGQVLSGFVPRIWIRPRSTEEALLEYGRISDFLRREHYRRKPKMRLLRKSSLVTRQGVSGWELSYMAYEAAMQEELQVVVYYYLLEKNEEEMVEVIGTAPFEARDDFGLVCGGLINSVRFE